MANKSGKTGTRSTYTIAKGQRICELICNGKGLRGAADAVGVSYRTARNWVERYPRFAAAYTQACETRLALLEDKVLELMEEAHLAACDSETGELRIKAYTLEINTLKWLLCKLIPKRYGDRTQMELTGRDGAELLPKHTREDLDAFAAVIAAAQAKTPPQHRDEAELAERA